MRLIHILLVPVCLLCCLVFVVPCIAEGPDSSDIRTMENTLPLTAAGHQGVLVLSPGWNFVSMPRKPAQGNATVKEIFGGVDLTGRSIFRWDGESGLWYQGMPDDVLKPLEGFWVYSATRVDIPLVFDTVDIPFPPSRQLYKGWNAVGVGGTTPLSARDTLLSLGSAWETVIGYTDGVIPDEPIQRGSTDPGSGESRMLVPFRGYWVFLNEDKMYLGLL